MKTKGIHPALFEVLIFLQDIEYELSNKELDQETREKYFIELDEYRSALIKSIEEIENTVNNHKLGVRNNEPK